MNNQLLTLSTARFHVVAEHIYDDDNKDSFRSLYLFSTVHGKIISAPYNHKNLKNKHLAMDKHLALKLAASMMHLNTLVRCELVKYNP